jgi:hypothetical protein
MYATYIKEILEKKYKKQIMKKAIDKDWFTFENKDLEVMHLILLCNIENALYEIVSALKGEK